MQKHGAFGKVKKIRGINLRFKYWNSTKKFVQEISEKAQKNVWALQITFLMIFRIFLKIFGQIFWSTESFDSPSLQCFCISLEWIARLSGSGSLVCACINSFISNKLLYGKGTVVWVAFWLVRQNSLTLTFSQVLNFNFLSIRVIGIDMHLIQPRETAASFVHHDHRQTHRHHI